MNLTINWLNCICMKPAYTQNINPQLGGFTQGYPTGVSLNGLTYQSPGFLNTNVPAIQ